MKRVLLISVLLNVMLLAAVGWRNQHETPVKPLRGAALEPAQQSAALQRNSPVGQLPRSKAWNFIASAEPREFIANLRAIGCPEETIRDIVVLKVCRDFRDRLLALETEAARTLDYRRQQNRDYWRERNEQRSEMRDEMISTLESLLGQSWTSLTTSLRGAPEWGRDPLESLSVETRRQIRDVDGKCRRELDELQQKKWTGELSVADMARIRDLEREKRAALANVLSPQELEEYLYRQSSAADYVRRNLPQAKSEAEFRAMVKLALEMEMSDATAGPRVRTGLDWPDDAKREAEQRKAEFDRRLKELLGETRLAEQQAEEQARAAAAEQKRKAQDEQRLQQELTTMAAEVGVSAEEAIRFYQRLKELEPTLDTKFKEMEKNLTGTPQEKQKQMQAAIQAEMERVAVEIMGEAGRALIEKMDKKR
jgi:hypothetical protein